MRKKWGSIFMVCLLELLLVGVAVLLFPDIAAQHTVAFVLGGLLILVSSAVWVLLDLYHREQRMLQQAQYELEKAALQDQVDFALRGIGGGILISREDEEKTFVYVSDSLAALFGYTVEEFIQVSGNKTSGIVHPEDLPLIQKEFTEETNLLRFRVRCKDGSLKWISSQGKVIVSERGERERYSVNHDITQLMETNRRSDELMELLRWEQQLYRDVLLYNCDYAYILNVDEDRFHYVYKGDFMEKYHFDPSLPHDEAVTRVVEQMKPIVLHGSEEFILTRHYAEAYRQGRRLMEMDYCIPDEGSYKKEIIFLSRGDSGPLYAFIVTHDITARKKEELKERAALALLAETAERMGAGHLDVTFDADAPGHVGLLADVLNQTVLNLKWHMERLRLQTTQDPMTGVKNKRAWQAAEERLNKKIQEGAACFAIAVCDINYLKQVNDTIGHDAGDDLIIRSCRHICRIFKHSPVFRIGGDEFTAILEGSDLAEVEELRDRFYAELAEQPSDNSNVPPISIALGIAHYGEGDADFSQVFQRADEAMYQKKTAMKAETGRDPG